MTRRLALFIAAFALAAPVLAADMQSTTAPASQPATQPVDNFKVMEIGGVESTFELKEHRGEWVVLDFLLKTECPICRGRYQEFSRRHKELGATVVFLKPDSKADIMKWMTKARKPEDMKDTALPVYRDPEAELAKKYGVPDGYKFHGEMVHYPATIVLDSNGDEVWRYSGKNNRDRPEFDDLKKNLDNLRGATSQPTTQPVKSEE